MALRQAVSLDESGLLGVPLTFERGLDPRYGDDLIDDYLTTISSGDELTEDQKNRIIEWTALVIEYPGVFIESVLCEFDSQMDHNPNYIQKRFRAATGILDLYNQNQNHSFPVLPADIIEEGFLQYFVGVLEDSVNGDYTRIRKIIDGSRSNDEIHPSVEGALLRAIITRIAGELYSVGKPDFREVEFMLTYFSHYGLFSEVSAIDLVVLSIGEALDHLSKIVPRSLVFRRGVELLCHLGEDNQSIPETIKRSISNVNLSRFFTEAQSLRVVSGIGYYLREVLI